MQTFETKLRQMYNQSFWIQCYLNSAGHKYGTFNVPFLPYDQELIGAA